MDIDKFSKDPVSMVMSLAEKTELDEAVEQKHSINTYRKWFQEAVDFSEEWQDEAQEDYDFVAGQQWSESDKRSFEESGRPAITLNRIKPLMNVLSGYQRLNRYDIDFLPRTGDDINICQVRKGLTKYILDRCDYDSQESQVFMDAAICGLGWFDIGYKIDREVGDGEAYVRREDPFGVYVDPEAHKTDFSDARYICRAKWVDKDDLKEAFPEFADDIEAQYQLYDSAERVDGRRESNLWYKTEPRKIRLVECWYKVKDKKTMYYLTDGSIIPQEEVKVEYFLNGLIEGQDTIPYTKIKFCSFFDNVLLEDIDSPYQHGEFPLVPLTCYYYGAGDLPAGFVRDLKDPQREINKRRIQMLHILNTSGNGGGWIEEDAMTPEQEADFKRHGAIPGHFQKVKPMAIQQNKIQERSLLSPPNALIQAESQATNDLQAISGINEALMGSDIPNSVSGRAIELRQKQAITHIAPMFDNLRKAKKKIANLLWGRRGHAGIVPQFYTEDKVYRVEGENGQQFIRVNQQIVQQDPMGNIIHQTMNNLSEGEFDIVIADVSASTTQRQAQLWSIVDAVKSMGVDGSLVFDIILDLSDIPGKEKIMQKYQQQQQAQQQAAQAQAQQQIELEKLKMQNMNMNIAYKDAPLPVQLAMAAKQGLIDPQIAQYSIDLMVQQMFPQLAQQMEQQKAQAAQQQQMAQMQQLAAMQAGQIPPQMAQPKPQAGEAPAPPSTIIQQPQVRPYNTQQAIEDMTPGAM